MDLGSEADFEVCISSIKDQLGLQPAVLQYPYYNSNGDLDGILDVLNERICTGDQGCLSRYSLWQSHSLVLKCVVTCHFNMCLHNGSVSKPRGGD